MRVEYIGHSGVLIELEELNLLFDCIAPVPGPAGPPVPRRTSEVWHHDIGSLPQLDPDKFTLVFASHAHGDHYSEEIWNLRGLLPRLHYVLSKDIPFSSGVRARLGITEADLERITFVKNYSSQELLLQSAETAAAARNAAAARSDGAAGGDGAARSNAAAARSDGAARNDGTAGAAPLVEMPAPPADGGAAAAAPEPGGSAAGTGTTLQVHVQTLPSTDAGVAFLVRAEGRILYHAGDHHLWLWEGEGPRYMADMQEVFGRTLSRLELAGGETVDAACLLLDPRLEVHAYDGLDAYLEALPVRHVIPIHQWKHYELTDAYRRDRAEWLRDHSRCREVKIHTITGENCSFDL